MTFWDTFLVDVTYSCDPNFDCYPLPLASITYRSIPPIVNCSDYVTLPDNMTIVCFTFTFDYSQAFGAAGGVFAFAVFGIRIVLGIIIWLKSKYRKCCLSIVLFGIFYGVPITLKPPNRGHFGDGPFVPCRRNYYISINTAGPDTEVSVIGIRYTSGRRGNV